MAVRLVLLSCIDARVCVGLVPSVHSRAQCYVSPPGSMGVHSLWHYYFGSRGLKSSETPGLVDMGCGSCHIVRCDTVRILSQAIFGHKTRMTTACKPLSLLWSHDQIYWFVLVIFGLGPAKMAEFVVPFILYILVFNNEGFWSTRAGNFSQNKDGAGHVPLLNITWNKCSHWLCSVT